MCGQSARGPRWCPAAAAATATCWAPRSSVNGGYTLRRTTHTCGWGGVAGLARARCCRRPSLLQQSAAAVAPVAPRCTSPPPPSNARPPPTLNPAGRRTLRSSWPRGWVGTQRQTPRRRARRRSAARAWPTRCWRRCQRASRSGSRWEEGGRAAGRTAGQAVHRPGWLGWDGRTAAATAPPLKRPTHSALPRATAVFAGHGAGP